MVAVDTVDVVKQWGRRMEGLGLVKDHSDPQEPVRRGYMLAQANALVGRRLVPLDVRLLKAYAGRGDSENRELLAALRAVNALLRGAKKSVVFVLDRGFDRREILEPLLREDIGFVVRLAKTRHVVLEDGRRVSVSELMERCRQQYRGVADRTWTFEVRLPGLEEYPCLLVVYIDPKRDEPLCVLVSPAARRRGRTGRYWVRRYLKRWSAEDCARGLKQCFELEKFLVRSWQAIEALQWLCAIAFFWLNLYGEEHRGQVVVVLEELGYVGDGPKYLFYAFSQWIMRELHATKGRLCSGP